MFKKDHPNEPKDSGICVKSACQYLHDMLYGDSVISVKSERKEVAACYEKVKAYQAKKAQEAKDDADREAAQKQQDMEDAARRQADRDAKDAAAKKAASERAAARKAAEEKAAEKLQAEKLAHQQQQTPATISSLQQPPKTVANEQSAPASLNTSGIADPYPQSSPSSLDTKIAAVNLYDGHVSPRSSEKIADPYPDNQSSQSEIYVSTCKQAFEKAIEAGKSSLSKDMDSARRSLRGKELESYLADARDTGSVLNGFGKMVNRSEYVVKMAQVYNAKTPEQVVLTPIETGRDDSEIIRDNSGGTSLQEKQQALFRMWKAYEKNGATWSDKRKTDLLTYTDLLLSAKCKAMTRLQSRTVAKHNDSPAKVTMHRLSKRIGCSELARSVGIMILCFSTFLVAAASAQSTDSTSQAKRHYQNAVMAIDKGDWQTAKTELLQAAKLTPNNALVHYDLALAYSHTGQSTLAKSELGKALQLGMPAEQKKAAEELRQELDAAAKTPQTKDPSAGTNGTGAKHSTAEIVGWIVSHSELNKTGDQGISSGAIARGSQSDDCVLTFYYQFQFSRGEKTNKWQMVVPVGTLDPEKIEVLGDERGLYQFVVHTTNERNTVEAQIGETTQTGDKVVKGTGSRAWVYFDDSDLANRMKKAFGDLIRQCGGKPSVGNIY